MKAINKVELNPQQINLILTAMYHYENSRGGSDNGTESIIEKLIDIKYPPTKAWEQMTKKENELQLQRMESPIINNLNTVS